MIIDETSGLHGVRDRNTLSAVEALPQQTAYGKELYPSIFQKAAVYARTIIMNHPFLDGNKRTGTTSALIFLENNGYRCTLPEGGVVDLALEIVLKRLEIDEIAQHLETGTQKLPD